MSIEGGAVALEARAPASSVGGPLWCARSRRLQALAAAALLVVAGLAAATLWAGTSRFGIGVENDGVVYLAGARNWLRGDGISWISGGGEVKPIVHFPPLMSLLLAGLDLLSFELLEAGRLLNVAAFGLNGFLIGLCLWRITRSALVGLAGEILFLVTPAIVTIHSYALTDGPFLTFALIAAILMGEYFERRSMTALGASGVAAGLAYLLRYVGVALVVALASTLLVHRGIPRKRRLLATAVFLAPALLPISIWFLRNMTRTGRISSFQVLFHGDYAAGFADGYRLMLDWFLPGRLVGWVLGVSGLPAALVALAVVTLPAIGVVLLRSERIEKMTAPRARGTAGFFGIFFATHVLTLYVSKAAFFPPARIEERTLAPAYLAALVFLLLGMSLLASGRRRALRAGVFAVFVLLVLNKLVWTVHIVERLPVDGVLGYTNAAWRSSETMVALEELSPSLIYTNNVAAVWLLMGRLAYDLPEEVEVPRADIDPNYESLDSYRKRLQRTPGAVVALFGGDEVLPGAGVFDPFTTGLQLLGDYADGAIYSAAGALTD